MSRSRLGLYLFLVAGLTACSGERSERADQAPTPTDSVGAPHTMNSAPAEAVAAPASTGGTSIGGGSSLTGKVSGLAGRISGFAVRQTQTQTIVELAADVLFAFDSAQLTPEAEAALRRTAELAAEAGEGPIIVVGHTDSVGEDAYNLRLSRQRAEAVTRWLAASGGVPAGRLKAEGRGEAEPVAANTRPDGQDDPESRARNRRVVVTMPRG